MNTQRSKQPAPSEHWVEKLDDGTPVLIRPLRQEDHERNRRFLSSIAHQARRLRLTAGLSGGVPSLPPQAMPVDDFQRRAYVALAHVDGCLQQIGISRYAGLPDSPRCECAIAVREEWQRKGLGTRLLRHLVDAARRSGYEWMISRDLSTNYAMHRMTKALGFSSRYLGGDVSEILHELDLRA